jgi:hypothetical protein
MAEKRNAYRLLVGTPEGNRQLERPRPKWVDNSEMNLRKIGRGSADWIGLVQDSDKWRALVNATINFRVP